ncbi:hypothetical protein D3C80_1177570 [compost metagenome]
MFSFAMYLYHLAPEVVPVPKQMFCGGVELLFMVVCNAVRFKVVAVAQLFCAMESCAPNNKANASVVFFIVLCC